MENVLRRGKLRLWLVDDKAVIIIIMAVGLVSVNRQKREPCDQLKRLPQDVGKRNVICVIVIGIQRQHAPGQCDHHICTGRLHDNITHKAGRQRTVVRQQRGEIKQRPLIRQLAEQQKIGDLLKTKPFLADKAFYDLINIDPPVVKLALTWNRLTLFIEFGGTYLRNLGQPRQHTLSVDVPHGARRV